MYYRQNYRHFLCRYKGIIFYEIYHFLLSISQLNLRQTYDITYDITSDITYDICHLHKLRSLMIDEGVNVPGWGMLKLLTHEIADVSEENGKGRVGQDDESG